MSLWRHLNKMGISSVHLKCFVVAIIYILQVTKGSDSYYCFKSYSGKHSACRGRLHLRDDRINVDDCCKNGRGYAVELHRSQHGKKWFNCESCPSADYAKEQFEAPVAKGQSTSVDRGKFTDVSEDLKDNDIIDKNDLYHRKKLVAGDKFRRRSAAAGRKAKKIAWSAWSDWGPCSSICEPGIQQRSRTCSMIGCHGDDVEQRACQPADQCSVDGGWSPWGPWSECSTSCGYDGTRRRERRCDNPLPQHSGRPCDGEDTQTSSCPQTTDCSVDGGWSEWSHLDVCSAKPCSQEIGFRIRLRSCTSPSPMFGGMPCQGRSWKRETCYNNDFCTKPVDGAWCAWSDWTECDSAGLKQRQRSCQCPPPVSGGLHCQGEAVQKVTCSELNMPKETQKNDDTECDGVSSGDGPGCDAEGGDFGSANSDEDETNDSEK